MPIHARALMYARQQQSGDAACYLVVLQRFLATAVGGALLGQTDPSALSLGNQGPLKGRRDVVFLHADDLAARGLAHGDMVDIEAVAEDVQGSPQRIMRNFVAVALDIARGVAAAYYPKANGLIALGNFDPRSGTPS